MISDIEGTTMVEWVTALSRAEIDAHRELFSRIYPQFIPGVTARYDQFEQIALTMDGDGVLLSSAGSRRRHVAVGDAELVISGVGGVMTNPRARRRGAARRTLGALASTFGAGGRCESDFGFLQCRPAIAPFYEAVGWTRVDNEVHHVDEQDGWTPVTSTGPTLVISGTRPISHWPAGMVDLRGVPW